MATVVTRVTVGDYAHWRGVFDGGRAMREGHGCTTEKVYRDAADDSAVLVVLDFPSVDSLRAYLSDPALKERMAQAGSDNNPRFEVYEAAD